MDCSLSGPPSKSWSRTSTASTPLTIFVTSVIVVTRTWGRCRSPTFTKPLLTVWSPGARGTHGFTSVGEAPKFFGLNVLGILLGGVAVGVEAGPLAPVVG